MASPERRVCLFMNSYTYGGVEEHVALLCEHLPRHRWTPIVVCADIEALRPLHDRLDAQGTRWLTMPQGTGPASKAATIARFAKFLRQERVGVLHTQLIYSEGGRIPVLGGTLARVPIVVTHHAAPREPQPMWNTALRTPFLAAVKRFIAVSHANEKAHVELLGLPAKRTGTVHNGIRVPELRPNRKQAHQRLTDELQLSPGAQLIGGIGRLSDQKGFDRLIAAAPAILEKCPDTHFLFAGEGPLKDALQAQAQKLGVSGHVRWLGFRRDVQYLLAGIDVLAMPSVFEGLPLVLLEAFAAGCPSVAHAVDGIPEIIDDGDNGYLVPPASTTLLAERISALLTSPALCETMSARAHEKALASFTVEKMTAETASIYDSMLC